MIVEDASQKYSSTLIRLIGRSLRDLSYYSAPIPLSASFDGKGFDYGPWGGGGVGEKE